MKTGCLNLAVKVKRNLGQVIQQVGQLWASMFGKLEPFLMKLEVEKLQRTIHLVKEHMLFQQEETSKKALSKQETNKIIDYVHNTDTLEARSHAVWVFSYLGNELMFLTFVVLNKATMMQTIKK